MLSAAVTLSTPRARPERRDRAPRRKATAREVKEHERGPRVRMKRDETDEGSKGPAPGCCGASGRAAGSPCPRTTAALSRDKNTTQTDTGISFTITDSPRTRF